MSKNKSRKRKQQESDKRRSAQIGQVPSGPYLPERSVGKVQSKPGSFVSFHGFRELVESVVIAFILAFLFRTFEAEAFVIPTGSMANTLMGRHKDLQCDKCGYPFQVSASEEIGPKSGRPTGRVVSGGVCPMCRHSMILRGSLKKKDNRSFNGDRIIVGKFMYQFEEPQRWDVSVFKYPAESKTNFIKRLVGLPNETLRINRGDIFTKSKGEEEFFIARKPPDKMRAMLKTVYDNDYVLPGMIEKGWPARWQDANGPHGWKTSSDHREFTVSGKRQGTAWLQYRHIVPMPADWNALERGPLPANFVVKPQLIADFTAYNAGIWKGARRGAAGNGIRGYGTHWVGDLAVQCELQVESPSGKALLKLVEGGRDMLCTIDLASGKATLSISGDTYERVGSTPISKPGTYKLMFSNVDDQLGLWVDDDLIAFDKPTTYKPLHNQRPQKEDLAPVGIGSQGAKLRVGHLEVLRDIYYIADKRGVAGVVSDFDAPFAVFGGRTPHNLTAFFSDPDRWDVFESDAMGNVEFRLDEDQFLMLGDNSSMSRDSRLWNPNEYYVDRELLIGKALFIYWPHSWDKLPDNNIPFLSGKDIPFPFFPNVKEMKFVR